MFINFLKFKIIFSSLILMGLFFCVGIINVVANTTPPFTSQAPFGQWSDNRQQNACEEASVLMAIYWAQGKELTKQIAKAEIIKMAEWEKKNYNSYVDTSAQDTLDRLIRKYFKYNKARLIKNATLENVKTEIKKGNIVIAPCDGRKLKNPYFTPPGPEQHMLVIYGYDEKNKVFITNDPGTKRGAGYKYKENILYNAIRDYPTGAHTPFKSNAKNIIIVAR
jgi:hypothetical protein